MPAELFEKSELEDASRPLLEELNTNNKTSHVAKMWPYLVLVSSVLSYAMASGFNLGIAGAITVAQSQHFRISLEQASWTISVHTVFYLIMNPVCAIMTNLFSIRKIQLLGFFISTLGIGLCGFATTNWHVVVLFGMIAGVGLSLIRSCLFGILPYHFEGQNLYVAISAVFIGMNSGWLIISAPASYSFYNYGFCITMFLGTPLMLTHLLGVIFYSQDGRNMARTNLPEEGTLRERLRKVLTDYQVWIFLLGAFARKFGQVGFFTIYQDYALNDLGMTSPEASLGATSYGVSAIVAGVFITLTHTLKWKYNILVSLVVAAFMNGASFILLSLATNKAGFYVIMGFGGIWHGIFNGNLINVGKDIVSAKNIVLIAGFEACGSGVGGLCGPPVISYLQESVGIKLGLYASGASMIGCGAFNAIIAIQRAVEHHREEMKEKSKS